MFGEGRGKALIEGIEIAVTEPLLNDAAKDLFVLFDGHCVDPFFMLVEMNAPAGYRHRASCSGS
jgi:hypothetical protein